MVENNINNTEFLKACQAKREDSYSKMRAIVDATPLCINVWNSRMENIMCNDMLVDLFELENENSYLKEFYNLSPKSQPDGKTTAEASVYHMDRVKKNGIEKFLWFHCKLNGEEIPCEITLSTVDVYDEFGEKMIIGFTRDLRPQLAGNDEEEDYDGFFFGSISTKALFSVIAELSEEWFFAYDIRNSLIQFYGKGSDLLSLPKDKRRFPEIILDNGLIYEDDMEIFDYLCEALKSDFTHPRYIRLNLPNGNIRYFRTVFQTKKDKNGNPTYSVGKVFDIHEQKSFEMLSKTDLLTNCYNKITSETLIKETLATSKDSSHALFIVDIDDFKSINDNLGHHFGDVVLSDIATNLRAHFRGGDIIGRIGGDEFIVFVKNIRDKRIITERAMAISKVFQNAYSGEREDYKVSGSIGIALYKKDGETYEELYKAADKALYQSKLKGKDCFTYYTAELVDGTMKNRTVLENASRIANTYFDTQLVSVSFDLLYEANDFRSAIDAVLQFVGRRANVDRSYIFETFDGGKTYDNTYEWCKDGINPEIDN